MIKKNLQSKSEEEKIPVYEDTWVKLNFTYAVHKKR